MYLSSIVAGNKLPSIDSREWLNLIQSGCLIYGWVVVKQKRKEKYFDEDDGSEDSDCETWLDQAGCSVTETKDSGKKESGQDTLPILSIGSCAT